MNESQKKVKKERKERRVTWGEKKVYKLQKEKNERKKKENSMQQKK